MSDASKKFNRLIKRADRWSRLTEKANTEIEKAFDHALAELEAQRKEAADNIMRQEEELRAQLDQAGREFTHTKYALERDGNASKDVLARAEDEMLKVRERADRELRRLSEEKTQVTISSERQKGALKDLYTEKRRSLLVNREKLVRTWTEAETKWKETRESLEGQEASAASERDRQLAQLRETAASKQHGWDVALATLKGNLEAITREKTELSQKLAELQTDKEKELDAAKIALDLAREQVDIDKATLIEKAEEDQRRCETDVSELQGKIERSERELQNLLIETEGRKKSAEEAFEKEEALLKETVKAEAEKRDYEQKLLEQERKQKEAELARVSDEYERKKWQWDNQIRTLMMQKSVKDAEHDAERLRTDRDARSSLRGFEAKRDELKQRLAEIKQRHDSFASNAEKEREILEQRWRWRKERLWSMWQSRLETLKKERLALQEQLDALMERFKSTQARTTQESGHEEKKVDELRQFVLQMEDRTQGQRKQREVQFELEKTRFLAQIKELETLIEDWVGRLKSAQEASTKSAGAYAEQLRFLDTWFQQEEKETVLFLHTLRKALAGFEGGLISFQSQQDAA